jgi:hypothetical protein
MKKILSKNVGIGFLLLIVFNLVLFLISLPFGFEGGEHGPTLLPMAIFAVIMGMVVWLFLKYWIKPASQKEAWSYSLSWAGIVFALILLITIPNGTTKTFFGPWFDWLWIFAMALAPIVPLNYKK